MELLGTLAVQQGPSGMGEEPQGAHRGTDERFRTFTHSVFSYHSFIPFTNIIFVTASGLLLFCEDSWQWR